MRQESDDIGMAFGSFIASIILVMLFTFPEYNFQSDNIEQEQWDHYYAHSY